MSDLTLRQDVLDELEFEPSVNAAHIGVVVDKNVVTLTGHTMTYTEKTTAVAAARRVKGVAAIADEVEVRFEHNKKTSDDEIAKRAIDILAWNSLVPRDAISITVRDGLITLGGNVDWYYQRKNAEEDVHKLSGVRGVINSIVVKPRVQAQDVRRKIEDALKRNAELEAKAIRVTVKEGSKVLLEGKVNNWEELYAAENAAWSAPGVRSVETKLALV